MDALVTWFWVVVAATVVALGGALWSGWRARRGLHLVVGPVTLVLLGIAIALAVLMGRELVFPPEVMAIHKRMAWTGTALVLPVVVTGLLLVRDAGWRRAHLVCVVLFVLAVLAATGTGTWAFTQATPR